MHTLISLANATSTFNALKKKKKSGHGSSHHSSSLHFPAPIFTAIFAFCIIFAVVTFLQVLLTSYRIRRKFVRDGISPIGLVFPTFLFISTVLLTIAYAVHGALYDIVYNNNPSQPPLPVNHLYIAWHVLEFLTDIFLISGILALIRRRQSFISHSLTLCGRIVDAALMVALLILSMASVGLGTKTNATAKNLTTSHHLYVAYSALFLLAVANATISSVLLYLSSRKSKIYSHGGDADGYNNMKVGKTMLLCTFPLLLIHALYPLIWEGIVASGHVVEDPSLAGVPSNHHIVTQTQFDLGGLVIRCFTEVVVIELCSRMVKNVE